MKHIFLFFIGTFVVQLYTKIILETWKCTEITIMLFSKRYFVFNIREFQFTMAIKFTHSVQIILVIFEFFVLLQTWKQKRLLLTKNYVFSAISAIRRMIKKPDAEGIHLHMSMFCKKFHVRLYKTSS